MTTSTAPDRHDGRSRMTVIVVTIVAVSLLAAVAIWAGHRHAASTAAGAPQATGPGVIASATPSATATPAPAKARTPVAKTPAVKKPAARKPAAKSIAKKPAVKKAGGTVSGPAVAANKKLPAGIVEPGRKVTTPVDVKKTAVADSVRVDLTAFRSVKSQASGIGEISAPAVRLTIRLTNTGAKNLALNYVVVNAYYGSAGTPGVLITGDPASKPFTGTLKPGAKASAVFVFNMPVSVRRDATITVSPSPTLPIVVFAGSVA